MSSTKSKSVKIRIWSKSPGTKLLRTTGFIEIPRRPKILSLIDKSLETFYGELTQFSFTYGFQNLTNNAKLAKY